MRRHPTPDYYRRRIGGVLLDPYRIERAYGGLPAPLFSALKKILAAGQRGAKNARQDIDEAIDALRRWQEMEREDEAESVDASAIFNAPAGMEDAPENEIVTVDGDAICREAAETLHEYMTAGYRTRIAELERERNEFEKISSYWHDRWCESRLKAGATEREREESR